MQVKRTGVCIAMVLCAAILLGHMPVAQAADKVGLAFDGIAVPEQTEDNLTTYYLDAEPTIKNGTAFVPVRLISELLGAEVSWQGQNISIKYGDVAIQLTVGSQSAKKGQQTLTLGAAPYEQKGRTFVPVRFIAEAFACQVDWADNQVNVHSNSWQLNGSNITGIASRVAMSDNAKTYACFSPLFAQKMYELIMDKQGAEVAAPPYYGLNNNMDMANFYWQTACYQLLTAVDNPVWQVEIYECAGNGFGQPLPEGYTKHLLLINDKWYTLAEEDFDLLVAWHTLANFELMNSQDFLQD